ncbi:MAG TPA: molybdopterin cofactor-binding domain-containing protein [Streptosporangiaceae bacterium]|nr:molybdopterin cofactor-binding domain-containing protein [Streptosporangiaceae bacterium]
MAEETVINAATTLTVNGTAEVVPAAARLLSTLRDQLGLTGAKPGCGEGVCGACTVLVDRQPMRSCQLSASEVGGAVTTIEGIGAGPVLHPVQRAFAEEGAAQCGYCTPGMILATVALLDRDPRPDDAAIDAALAGQICRCGGYPRIRRAVYRAARLGECGGLRRVVAGQEPDRWGPPEPGQPHYRPAAPWDLTPTVDRDWFGALGDGLVVVLEPPEPSAARTTARGAWMHISCDGLVTAFTGKVDVGQDNRTALRLLVAEELEVSVDQVRLAMGDTDVCPHDLGTFGSRSMPDAGRALRVVAAYARGLSPAATGDRRIEIVVAEPALSDPARWQQAGRPRLGPAISLAVTGERKFVSDLDCPTMLHGALLRPPKPTARLRSVDGAVLRAWPSATLIRAGELIGVVAPELSTARDAVAALQTAAQWDLPGAPSDPELNEYLRAHQLPSQDGGFLQQEGSTATALEMAAVRCEASYEAAYIAPAALETRVALAQWDEAGRVTVWTGTQTPFPVRAQVAAATGVDERAVRVIVPPTGGAFGGKHAAQIAIEAAVLAQHAGRPVRVAWSRAEEFTVGTLRRAAVIDVAAGASADGDLLGWNFTNINAGTAGIGTPYRVADLRIEYAPTDSPLLQGSYRGLAATANNFARESIIDELAGRLGLDPVAFRLRNLADDRLAAVLRAVADYLDWPLEPGGSAAGGPAVGWGIACGVEKDGRVATAACVTVGPDSTLKVTRLVSGYECGTIVNPRTVAAQVEGAAVMALGGALFEAIEFTDGVITNAAFSRYRVPRIDDVPPIEVILLDRPDLPSAGAGEAPMIAVAPAIAGAIFAATGRRLRSLPLRL